MSETPSAVPRPRPWFARSGARAWTCAPASADVRAFHAGLAGYAPTPLAELPALAQELGVGRVFVKDESSRLGLPAFKVLGASWAVHRILSERKDGPGGGDRPLQLITATDGNHGRAVAHMARLFGLGAHIFVPEGVHSEAVAAIAGEGAQITRVAGNYDDAVRRAAEAVEAVEAAQQGTAAGGPDAVLLQDTAWPGHEQIPGWIVEGYSTLFAEIDAQLAAAGAGSPGLVVVPVGVGSLAQAAITHYRSRSAGSAEAAGAAGTTALMAVEPEAAACALANLHQQELTTVPTGDTIMAGLNAGTVSSLAWPYLRDGLNAAIAVTDAASAAAVHDLAALGIGAGPCGAAPLAGARAALTGDGSPERRAALGIGPDTIVVLLSTEGIAANPLRG